MGVGRVYVHACGLEYKIRLVSRSNVHRTRSARRLIDRVLYGSHARE